MGFQALAASHLLGIPILGTCHVLLAGFLRYAPISIDGLPLTEKAAWLYTITLYNRFPQVTVPSNYMKGALQAHGLRVPLATVSNGVDTHLFRPLEELQPEVDRPFTVIHVGRLGYEKRVSMLLRAFWLLCHTHPQSRLVIVGDGSEAGKLRDEARLLGISDRVQFLGHIAHEELPALYRNADVFATASNIETEGLVVLEAMACGLPVVGVDAAALPDAIQDGVTGLLTPPEDVPALAQALAHLFSAPELRVRMGKASREKAEHHGLHFTAASYEILYQAVQDQTPRRLIPGMIATPSIKSILASLKTEGNTMASEGVDKVWEVAEAVGTWTLSSVIDPIRNGITGHQEKLDR
jgi:glycosyltransferase involved in cell wall biosynthesis